MSTDPFPPQPDPGPGATPPASSYPPPPSPGPGVPPSGGDRFFDSIRRSGLVRSEDRWVGGVAGGIAERLGWDPLLVRGLLFLSFFITGIGLVAYGIGWALLPERSDGRIHLQQAIRGDFDVALLGAGASLLVGFGWSGGVGSWWGGGGWHWLITLVWIAVWVVGIGLLVKVIHDRRRDRQQRAPGAPTYPTQPGPATFAAPADAGPAAGPAADAGTQARSAAADARAQAAAARAQAAGVRAQYAQERARASRDAATARAAAQQQRAYARAVERSKRPITKSAGAGTVGAVIGLVLIAGALLLAQNRTGITLPRPFDGSFDPVLAWLGVSLVIVGAGIVISGMRGRSSGWLGFFAIVGLVVALPWSVSANGVSVVHSDTRITTGSGTVLRSVQGGTDVGQGTVTVGSIAEAERGFRAQFGDPTIDLSGLDLSAVTPGSPVEVPIQITAGDLTVVVPHDSAVEADVRILAGQVTWRVDPVEQTLSRVGSSTAHLSSEEASRDGATLRLLISAGAGNVTVEEN